MRNDPSHNIVFFSNRFLGLLFLFAASAVCAQTTTFQLNNGDRITGIVISESTNRVTISNAWSKEIILPLADIKFRLTNAPIVAVTNVPAPVNTNIPAVTAPATSPAPIPAPLASSPKPSVKPKGPKEWHTDIQVGADVGLGETMRELYHARLKVLYTPALESGPGNSSRFVDRFKNLIDFSAAYGTVTVDENGSSETKLSANRIDASSKSDFDLGAERRMFVYNLLGGGYDEIRRIEERYEIGPGLGYHMLKRTNMVLNLEAGLNYQAQYQWTKPNRLTPRDYTWNERVYYRFAEDFTWNISKLLTFDEKFEIYPEVNFEDYRLRFESNLRYWLFENLSLNLTVLDTYDTQTPNGVDKNDLQIRSSIGVKF